MYDSIVKLAEAFYKMANMSVEEAGLLLNVKPGASKPEIEFAYKKILHKIYLSSGQYIIPPEIRAAREMLINDLEPAATPAIDPDDDDDEDEPEPPKCLSCGDELDTLDLDDNPDEEDLLCPECRPCERPRITKATWEEPQSEEDCGGCETCEAARTYRKLKRQKEGLKDKKSACPLCSSGKDCRCDDSAYWTICVCGYPFDQCKCPDEDPLCAMCGYPDSSCECLGRQVV